MEATGSICGDTCGYKDNSECQFSNVLNTMEKTAEEIFNKIDKAMYDFQARTRFDTYFDFLQDDLEKIKELHSSQLTALTEENEKLRGDLELVNKCWNADLSGIEDLRSGLKDEELANEALTEENKQLKEALEQHQQVINNYAANFERDKDSIYNLVSRNEALTESNRKLTETISRLDAAAGLAKVSGNKIDPELILLNTKPFTNGSWG